MAGHAGVAERGNPAEARKQRAKPAAAEADRGAVPLPDEARHVDGQFDPDARRAAGQIDSDARHVTGRTEPDVRRAAGRTDPDARQVDGQIAPDARRAAGQTDPDEAHEAERDGTHRRQAKDGVADREAATVRAAFPGLNPELAAFGEAGSRPEKRTRDDVEAAAELGTPETRAAVRVARTSASGEAGSAAGILALAIAVASLFVWSLPLGLIATALGLFAFREGARGLGAGAAILGLTAAAAQLVLIPIQAAW